MLKFGRHLSVSFFMKNFENFKICELKSILKISGIRPKQLDQFKDLRLGSILHFVDLIEYDKNILSMLCDCLFDASIPFPCSHNNNC